MASTSTNPPSGEKGDTGKTINSERDNEMDQLKLVRYQRWKEGFLDRLSTLPQFADLKISPRNGVPTSTAKKPDEKSSVQSKKNPTITSPNQPANPARKNVSQPPNSTTKSPQSKPTNSTAKQTNKDDKKPNMLEEMIQEFELYASRKVLFHDETSIWAGGEIKLKLFLDGRKKFVSSKFKVTPEIQNAFETYADVQISTALALNSTRTAKRTAVEQKLQTSYGKIDADLDYEWLSKSWEELENVHVKQDHCPLVTAFGSEWEAFYRQKKREKLESLFEITKICTKYQDKLNSLLDADYCVDHADLDSYYMKAENFISPFWNKVNGSDRALLNGKRMEIIKVVNALISCKNNDRRSSDFKDASRAVKFAVSKYCEAVEMKLENPGNFQDLSEAQIQQVYLELRNGIIDCFFGVTSFVYTKHWNSKRDELKAALQREEKSFMEFYATNQLCQELRLQTAVLRGAIAFRSGVLKLLSVYDNKPIELFYDINKILLNISTDLQIQFPSRPVQALPLLNQKLAQVSKELTMQDLFKPGGTSFSPWEWDPTPVFVIKPNPSILHQNQMGVEKVIQMEVGPYCESDKITKGVGAHASSELDLDRGLRSMLNGFPTHLFQGRPDISFGLSRSAPPGDVGDPSRNHTTTLPRTTASTTQSGASARSGRGGRGGRIISMTPAPPPVNGTVPSKRAASSPKIEPKTRKKQ